MAARVKLISLSEPVEKPADESYTDSIIGAAAGSSVVLAIAIAVQVLLRCAGVHLPRHH